MSIRFRKKFSVLCLLPLAVPVVNAAEQESTRLADIEVTAAKELKQSLGASVIIAEDIEKSGAVNDLADIVRTLPGVNLSGNTASGERGNNRQIDIRGMGPENTLILIDGKPVTSRNSVRMSWRGERDSRGDSNWVPLEDIQAVEVIRGPAAARFGSGAAGGVVNIVTKPITNTTRGAITYFFNQPDDKKEGKTGRIGLGLSGPIINDVLSYRIYGNFNRTAADALAINPLFPVVSHGHELSARAAGREGVRNKDIKARLAWRLSPRQTVLLDAAYSRQGNIYAGDTQFNTTVDDPVNQLYGAETNRLYRQSYALTHDGVWDWGDTKLTAQYDITKNSRFNEGLAGGGEGTIATDALEFKDNRLKTLRLAAETNIPFTWGVPQTLTLGAEYIHDNFHDASSLTQFVDAFGVSNHRSPDSSLTNWAVYMEDNIKVTDKLGLVPTWRFDHHSVAGGNSSPSLNFSYQLHPYWQIKGGIARAYKAPNLYQSNDNYYLVTGGNGCPATVIDSECYLQGNAALKAETSINKELGIEFKRNNYAFSAAWFRNDYKNKIAAGDKIYAQVKAKNPRRSFVSLLRWDNTKDAVVDGFEGNITLPLTASLQWNTNFTYMHRSEDKSTKNPLSVIPRYTVNSTLSWQISEKFDANLVYTRLGRQKPRQYSETVIETFGSEPLSGKELGGYGLLSASAGYRPNKNINLRLGVENIFNKQFRRDYDVSSAQSYNQPGRAVYGKITASF